MRFLFTMLDNPPGLLEEKSTAKLSYLKDDVGAGNQPSGGARRDRTDDLMLAKHALSQLSYGPPSKCKAFACNASGHSLANDRELQANPEDLPTVRQHIREANVREHHNGWKRT